MDTVFWRKLFIKLQPHSTGFFKNLSLDLKDDFPDVKGFSPTNLGYIKRFYLLYSYVFENHPQLGGKYTQKGDSTNSPQVEGNYKCPDVQDVEEKIIAKAYHDIFSTPWGHHKLLIDKFLKAPEKAIFYVQKTSRVHFLLLKILRMN